MLVEHYSSQVGEIKGINKFFSPKAKRKQGKVKFKGMMSLNDCFIALTVSSRKGNFLLAEKNKNKTLSRGDHLLTTAALGLCEVDSDTDSDDSAFGSDLDELKS